MNYFPLGCRQSPRGLHEVKERRGVLTGVFVLLVSSYAYTGCGGAKSYLTNGKDKLHYNLFLHSHRTLIPELPGTGGELENDKHPLGA